MNITPETPRTTRSIGGKSDTGQVVSVDVQVPQPYAAGAITLSEGEANALNQIVAENLSNNLRKQIVDGQLGADGNPNGQPHDSASAQALVDKYLETYELGVRRAGTGERQVTDPVEREARKIAREKARDFIKEQGGKPTDYDLGPIVDAIFEANREVLMKEGKKIVEAASKVSGGLDLGGIQLTPKAPATTDGQPAADNADGGSVADADQAVGEAQPA